MSKAQKLLDAVRETAAITLRLGGATGRLDQAAYYAVRRLIDRRAAVDLRWRGLGLAARGIDWPALQEVLIENEYGSLAGFLEAKPAPVVLDIGANIGTFALFVLLCAPDAIVHSFEPSAATHSLLAANAARNPACRWTTHHAAAWRADEPVRFANGEASTAGRLDARGEEPAAGLSLQSILARAGGHADVAKLDIEGAEEAVLADIPVALLEQIETMVVELHPGRCDMDRVVMALKRAYGTLYAIPGRRSSKPLLLATRSAVPHRLPPYHHNTVKTTTGQNPR